MLDKVIDIQQKNIEKCGYPYKFSVVMAVYNVESFLKEAVNSLINQSIGFDNIQLIMVDDGSTDLSGIICEEYKTLFPFNILVIHKNNGGVATARNEGLKHAIGKYINFMDSDDKFSLDAFEKVYKYFLENQNETDIVTIPLKFFDAANGEHWQNYKFHRGSRIIDLKSEYNAALMFVNSSFFIREKVMHFLFDPALVCGEDIKFIITILVQKMKMGVLSNCFYFYRRRSSGEESLVQTNKKKRGWYFEYFHHLTFWAQDFCEKELGYYPYFVQFVIAGDLQWRVRDEYDIHSVLTESEIQLYNKILCQAFCTIDDRIILEQKQVWAEHKCLMLQMKYGRLPDMNFFNQNAVIYFQNTNVFFVSDMYTKIDFIKIQSGKLIIEGYSMFFGVSEFEPIELFLKVNNIFVSCQLVDRNVNQYRVDNILLSRGVAFRGEYELRNIADTYEVTIHCKLRNYLIWKRDIRFGQFSPIGSKYKNGYYYKDKIMLTFSNSIFILEQCGKKKQIKQEIAFLSELLHSQKISDKKAFLIRLFHTILKHFLKKPIWLISDKAYRADDNGEALFKFLIESKKRDIKPYFIIGKDFPDFKRLTKVGRTIPHLSKRHKLLVTLASKSISAYSHMECTNPFQSFFEPFRDLLVNCDFVFLQHGTTQNDTTKGLNKYIRNVSLFITCSPKEEHFILKAPYHYQKNQIALCGFARYDNLYNSPKKIITIAPTWRNWLFSGFVAKEDRWILKNGFKDSDFYNLYISILNNKRLLEVAKKYGYQVHFFPHSIFFPYIDQFEVHEQVMIHGTEFSYRDMFAISDLLVTDYSSIAFDFAYLKKPVIYAQLDKNDFFGDKGMYKPGYFDYEKDGFGEVEYNIDATVNRITEYIKNNCNMKEKYIQRVNNFFAFNDKNNCERIYNAIMQMDSNR